MSSRTVDDLREDRGKVIMKDTFVTVLFISGLFIILPILILWLKDKVFHRKPTPEQTKEHGRRFKERLLSPDYASLEAHYGHVLPKLLKDLYANHKEILRSDFIFPSGKQ